MVSVTDELDAARAALARGDVIIAYDFASAAVTAAPENLDARYLVALALIRAGARDRARHALDDLNAALVGASDVGAGFREDAEALEGRLAKELALATHGAERATLAAQAARIYEAVADRHDRYFTCINAASMWLIAGDVERAHGLAERALTLTRKAEADEPDADPYWRVATEAEASLVLGHVDAASRLLARAAALGADVAARAVTGRQLRLLCEETGVDTALLDSLALPEVLHYCGHRITADAEAAGGFAASDEPAVAAEIAAYLDARTFDAAYGALACGADIMIAEALLERDVTLHIILPFGIDEFEDISVCSGGDGWTERYRSCLERAASVTIVYDSAYSDDPTLFGYCANVAMGHALHRARHLGIAAEQLAVWDGNTGFAIAGTGHDVAAWHAAGQPTHVIPVSHRRAAREQGAAVGPETPRRVGSIIFTDTKGFSSLRDEHQRTYVDELLRPMGEVLDAFGDKVQYRNTWGDAILAVCDDVATAAAAALALQAVMRSVDLAAIGLPENLGLRVSAHIGPLIELDDPLRGVPAYWGRELTRAARIEPRTPEGEVYVTEAFAAVCTLECGREFACEYVGRVTTAKEFETIPMYRLRHF
jgi:adenylate cyclase